ncbi:DUF748 domain-containing protein [Ulvibacterium marinum]|uniref:DUF748 domain-containing protein n=1 Tax=Ulvibacterium marinum TaxID=2419782 RepID=A0A3B0BSX1_9FLAO|nr:DUF748 domain-containing protein [Ulvibacterium marinum]RKN75117.1 DUF748 domain-containing protein [Ulvibacterium marinum]
MENKKRKIYKKKRYTLPIIIILLLVATRLSLPYILERYVNKVLADIPGYYGQVSDITISLFRGAYVIDNLYLNMVDAGSEVPFLDFAKTDISLEWKSLLKGKIVSEIILTRPQIIYIFEDQQKSESPEPELEDWTQALTDLVPIDINHLKVIDGKAAFVQLTAEPNIDLNLNQIELNATNLRNVVRRQQNLPSEIHATALSIGNGSFTLDGKMDLVKQIPDMDVSLSLENASATALNDFTKHYAGIDFVKGNFNLFSEVAIADGYLTGYVKPLLKDSQLVGGEQDGFLNTLWEGFVGFFKFLLKNKGNNTLATKVPIEGNLNNVKTKVWPTIWNVFKNGWIKAYKGVLDDEVNYEDAKKGLENEE